jgi:LysR family glycine cleavage system transcriptional activator
LAEPEEMRRLPLNAIRSFYLAAQAGRFRLAAELLGVTESAVSHQVKRLEQMLGVALFERQGREMHLTPVGNRYYASVRKSFGEMLRATAEVAGSLDQARVTLTLPTSLAAFWLIPRLGALQQRHPEINLQLLTTNRKCDFARENVDLGIRYGYGNWPGFHAALLLSEQFFPVATRAYMAKQKSADPAKLIRSARLIANALHPGEWEEWCLAHELAPPPMGRALVLESSELILQAALEGVGMAMGRRPIVDRLLASGQLVAPFGREAESAAGYYLVRIKGEPPTAAARKVERWLMEEAAPAPKGRRSGDQPARMRGHRRVGVG